MNRQEVILNYGVPEETMCQYDAMCHKTGDTADYTEGDIQCISRMIELRDMGVSSETAVQYMQMEKGEHTQQKKLQLLNRTREELLEGIHSREEQLIKLDYVRFQLQKEIKS